MRTLSIVALLLFGAHLNLTALVPAPAGQGQPPWWVGGGLLWPYFAGTHTLVPAGATRDAFTPLLAIAAATCLLLAAGAFLGWVVPSSWFAGLVVAGAVFSVALQVIWLSGWAVLPLAVDALLVWAVLAGHIAVSHAQA